MRIHKIISGLLALSMNASAEDSVPAQVLCSSQPVVCTGVASPTDRFDPLVQRVLVERQLREQPKSWQLIYFYVPNTVDTEALAELQIRFLNELIERERAAQAQKKAEEKAADEEK